MLDRRVHRLALPRGGPVANAVLVGAEKRATLGDLARDLELGREGIEALLAGATARVGRDAAGLGRSRGGIGRMPIGVPVAGPLPDIAGHVVEAVAVGREGADRRASGVAVGGGVLVREP